MLETEKAPNSLIEEKSPYLLQHAYNPVNWYPWGEEAFKKAREEDKPVFLSIGYSTCHWCHVMAHESFEDEEVAELINDLFIPIKVDREERPDIDSIYMSVCQMMTGRGGWPLTIFMTADKKPFFAGTYIPKESHYGRSGLVDLISKIKKLWLEDREKLINSADNITNSLAELDQGRPGDELDKDILNDAYYELDSRYDEKHAGFGTKPKFPIPHQLLFLLHYWHRTGEEKALEMVKKTLTAMRAGGIYDQLGFGFHRYSTDQRWLLPHFEKMLYDQALLAYTYTEAYQATGNDLFARTVKEIFTYIKRDMVSREGGFYSAEDADSEGVEGKFYLWSEAEILKLLSEAEANLFIEKYNIREQGNFNEESTGQKTGKNIPYLDLENIDAVVKKLKRSRKKLIEEREKRVHPHKDDKILTDWNGLMIAALARAGWVLKENEFIKLAEDAVNFIYNNLYTDQEILLHRYREEEAGIKANLNDYSFLIWGLIELYLATFASKYLEKAYKLNQQMLERFWDSKNGGLFFTSDSGEELLIREKKIYDGATPSGNSIALWNLIRLSHLTGDHDLNEKAHTMSRTFSEKIKVSPSNYSQFLIGIDSLIGPFYDIVISGKKEDQQTKKMIDALRNVYIPNLVILFRPEDGDDKITEIADFLEDYSLIEGKTTAYVCKNYSCQLPTTRVEEMLDQLL